MSLQKVENELNDSEMQRSQVKSGSTQRVNLVEQSKLTLENSDEMVT